MATKIYRQPKIVPTVVVGEEDNAKYLKETPTNVANSRSQGYKPTKTSGIKMRGTGCATKGLMSRGPMA
jgi:hypothetical protein